ncbi:transposable element Tcb2 transposase [Trichonephila clavipes]|uniref:Transposable element Tcb2 transposase n=1 Tax=Trichonephila clavipes TaxID=2585209 RepID=A0A8X6V248_TRICX|nr:transposable element Tcb2 transposase [Trichonephila clavipes]
MSWWVLTCFGNLFFPKEFAMNTVFGWVVAGCNLLRYGEQSCAQYIVMMKNIAIMNDLKLFWELDSIGIRNECESFSLSDKKFIDNFESNLTYNGNRYETKIPWKSNPEVLDCNFETAKRRFDNLKIKLNKNKDIGEEYKRIIDEQLKNGIVEECRDISLFSGYFMPHQAVIRPDKETSRVKIVFDASSKGKNSESLNDLLFSGPNLMPDVLHIILKFRKYEIAFSSDIEKAFLNISIAQEDRKYLKFLWFDIKNNDNFKGLETFRISNRISEIHNLTNPSCWQHCPGKSNTADRLTRGFPVQNLTNDDLWWYGPKWLRENKFKWLKLNDLVIYDKLKNSETRSREILQNLCTIVKLENFDSLLKVKRIMAWVKRFIFNCRNFSKFEGSLSADELHLVREVQMQHFREEINTLNRKQILKNSKLYSLRPYLDVQGILRISSRINEAKFHSHEINPIIIPKESKFTELIVKEKHLRLLHGGVTLTLSQIRRKYWIPQGRQLIRKIINRCLACKKHSVKPADQLSGQLPRDRISQSLPFTIIGVDFTGPVYVKLGNDTEKSYIALFTCAVTLAVYIELVYSLSTRKFILTLRRFLSRSNCKTIYSDNASTFKCASKEIQYFFNIIKDEDFKNFISSEGITWKFIVELAPWWGGFYERLMRSIKELLRKIIGRAQLTFEETRTILAEIENVLNHRPLTYVSDDISDPEALTPASFLLVRHKNEYPFNFSELLNSSTTRESLLKRKHYQTKLLSQFWKK